MTERRKEIIKSVIIILLTLSLLFMAALASVSWDSLYSGRSGQSEETVSAEYLASPAAIGTVSPSGEVSAVRYRAYELEDAFKLTLPAVSEALGSATELAPCTEQDAAGALEGPCIIWQYASPADARMICALCGIENDGAGIPDILRLIISQGRLFVFDGESYYSANTVTDYHSVAGISTESSDNACLASDIPALEGYVPAGTLIFTDEAVHPLYAAEYPTQYRAIRDEMMTSLGGGVFTSSAFEESDGTFVYVASDYTLRITLGGTVTYKYTGTSGSDDASLADSAHSAAAMVSKLCEPYLGEASLVSGGVTEEDGAFIFTFGLTVGGGRVVLSGAEHAVTVTVRGGAVTDMRAVLLEAVPLPESASLMGEKMAAAASADYTLTYVLSGDTLSPCWTETEGA